MEPTRRQQQILGFIRKFLGERGYPPTVLEIGAAVGLSSGSTVHRHLAKLEALGLVRRDPTKPRALTLADMPERDPAYWVSYDEMVDRLSVDGLRTALKAEARLRDRLQRERAL
jgi:SOS-response transcriptional repressor LexA